MTRTWAIYTCDKLEESDVIECIDQNQFLVLNKYFTTCEETMMFYKLAGATVKSVTWRIHVKGKCKDIENDWRVVRSSISSYETGIVVYYTKFRHVAEMYKQYGNVLISLKQDEV